ncbi:hypothetical protein [Sigmofec virus UA08Rod_5838]|uniref:Uncharacterized protein n=1 Tax=Sigmofec virus UA08Rod_5838 TaxID=2929442 RepID=A0A976R8I6_9VIRU|nr:hypothetical protein [Sigmofec virus UA08Rod_5838]
MQYLEFICPVLCAIFCIVHFIVEAILAHRQNKKIEKLCEKCGFPIYEDVSHNCALTSEQLQKLVEFVSSLKGE